MTIKAIKDKLKELDKIEIRAGWKSEHKYPNGTPVAYVATIQEYGYRGGGINIPARPFMRPAKADRMKKWSKYTAQQGAAFLTDLISLDHATDTIGQQIEDDIADKIINGNHQPLSPITLLLRKWRDDGVIITKSVVEKARRTLEADPNTPVSGRTQPLNDTELMLTSLTHWTVKK